MLSFFREKSSAAIIWLIILFALVHTQFLLHPPIISFESNNGVLDELLQPLRSLQSLLITLIYSLLIFTQALRLNYILNDERMFTKAAFTTAMSYVLLTAIYPLWQNVSAALICNSFLIWILSRILKFYQPSTSRGFIFNTGFIGGAIIILYHPALPLLLILFFALGILRPFRFNEWLLLLLGILAPFYMVFAYLFLSNNWQEVSAFIPKFHPHLLTPENKKLVLFTCITSGLLIISGMVVLQQYLPRMIIQVRKNWTIIFLFLLFFIPAIFLQNGAQFETIFSAAIPAAAFASCLFSFPKRNLFPSILFWLAIAEIIYTNWVFL